MANYKKTEEDWDKFLKRKQHTVSYETNTPDEYEEDVTGIKLGKKIIAVKKDAAGLKYKAQMKKNKEYNKQFKKDKRKASKSIKKTFRKVAKKSRKGGYTETPYGE